MNELKNVKVVTIRVDELPPPEMSMGRSHNVAENFVERLYLSKGYTVCRGIGKGFPDLIATKGDQKLYIEVKTDTDGIRMSQAIWAINNPDKNIVWIFLHEGETKILKLCRDPSCDIADWIHEL